jgi:hypothetical protein
MKSVRKSGDPAPDRKLVWIGGVPVIEPAKRGRCRVILPGRTADAELELTSGQAAWLAELIRSATPAPGARYPAAARDSESGVPASAWRQARAAGLLLV